MNYAYNKMSDKRLFMKDNRIVYHEYAFNKLFLSINSYLVKKWGAKA